MGILGSVQSENVKKSEAHKRFKRLIAEASTKSGTAHADAQAWETWWKGPNSGFIGQEPSFTDPEVNRDYLSGEKEYFKDPDLDPEGGLTEEDYLGLDEENKGKYAKDEASGMWFEKAATTIGEVKEQETIIAEESLRGYIADWERLTGLDTDEFQRELIGATQAMKFAEEEVISEFEEYKKQIGRAETAYEEDVEALTGEEIIDPITGEVISEGTYTAAISKLRKEKTEGLEETVVGREEAFETLREEATGGIRAAEAKMGAAGFAATGVGRTARDILAEEIGEEAEDIEAGFTEERLDITEGYLEDVGEEEKGKTSALDEYFRTREEAGEDLGVNWERATTNYQNLLKTYGIGEDLDTSPYGDITAGAEEALAGVQTDIRTLIATTRGIEGMETWDPFTRAGGFKAEGDVMGLGSYDEIPDPDFVTGLFQPTIEEFGYKPSEDLKLYDPEYALPWEEDTGLSGGGVPTIPGLGIK